MVDRGEDLLLIDCVVEVLEGAKLILAHRLVGVEAARRRVVHEGDSAEGAGAERAEHDQVLLLEAVCLGEALLVGAARHLAIHDHRHRTKHLVNRRTRESDDVDDLGSGSRRVARLVFHK